MFEEDEKEEGEGEGKGKEVEEEQNDDGGTLRTHKGPLLVSNLSEKNQPI